jgi:hypothetical protein
MVWPLFRTITEFVQSLELRTPLDTERNIIKSLQNERLTTLGYDELEGWVDPEYPQWPGGGWPPGSWPGGPWWGDTSPWGDTPPWGEGDPPVFEPLPDGDPEEIPWGAEEEVTDPVEALYRPAFVAGGTPGTLVIPEYDGLFTSLALDNFPAAGGKVQIPFWPSDSQLVGTMVVTVPSGAAASLRFEVSSKAVTTGVNGGFGSDGAVVVSLPVRASTTFVNVPLPPISLVADTLNIIQIERQAVSGDLSGTVTPLHYLFDRLPAKAAFPGSRFRNGSSSAGVSCSSSGLIIFSPEPNTAYVNGHALLPDWLPDGSHSVQIWYAPYNTGVAVGTQGVAQARLLIDPGTTPTRDNETFHSVSVPFKGVGDTTCEISTATVGSITKSGDTSLLLRQGSTAFRRFALLAVVVG